MHLGQDKPVRLTVTEFLILQCLAQRPGFVKSRDNLMDAAYDDQVYVDDRTIDSHIKRLRKKFKSSTTISTPSKRSMASAIAIARRSARIRSGACHGRRVPRPLAPYFRADAPHHSVINCVALVRA